MKILLFAVLALAGSLQLAAAGPRVERKLGQVSLGADAAQARTSFRAADVSGSFREALAPGESMLSFTPPFSLQLASGMIGHVYQGKVWRLEASFSPEYCRKLTWERFIMPPLKKYGKAQKVSKSSDPAQEKYVWEDAGTILTYTRDVSKEKGGAPAFYISLEDKAVWNALYVSRPAKAARVKAP